MHVRLGSCSFVMLVHDAKALGRKRRVERILSRLKSGTVVVEGKHDVRKLRMFGISAVSSGDVLYRKRAIDSGKTVYLMTDKDRGGEEKREKLLGELLGREQGLNVNSDLGIAFLKALNVRCAEQIYRPLTELLETNGEYNGENILRHSKVFDRG